MSTLQTINGTDVISTSRSVINDNFSTLNSDKIETSTLDTDTSLTANSDSKIATQKAVKAYVDSGGQQNASETVRGLVEEATDAEIVAGTDTGGTGAKLFAPPSKLNTQIDAKIASALPASTGKLTTIFETAGRFIATASTGGTNTFNTLGLVQTITSTNGRWVKVRLEGAYMKSFLGSPIISARLLISAQGNEANNQAYFGTGDVTTPTSNAGHTFTDRHIGFKLITTDTSGHSALYATQADGTTENASSALVTGLVVNDVIDVLAKVNGTSSVDYYYRKNGGAWSSATNLTSNFPTNSNGAGESLLQFSMHTKTSNSNYDITWKSASYER